MHSKIRRAGLAILLVVALGATSGLVSAAHLNETYTVRFENLTSGQPMSPIVAATRPNGAPMWTRYSAAKPELEAIAEDGNNGPMFQWLLNSPHSTDVVDVGAPLTTAGNTVMIPNGPTVTDTVTFEIDGAPGDRLSLATMLICTNDGFTGLDRAVLPTSGSVTYYLGSYDAETERNTEDSGDIVDPCSLLGPVALSGDPNGNVDDGPIDTHRSRRISAHDGIHGNGDLDPIRHGWSGPVAKVTITLN